MIPIGNHFSLNWFASKLQMSLQKKKQEWSKSIYLKGDTCISGFFFFREPGNWGKLWEWWKFNPFKRRCLVYFWIILFAHLIRESGNWGKLWEGSKFNLFKGDALCISGFFFVCWLSEGIDQTLEQLVLTSAYDNLQNLYFVY